MKNKILLVDDEKIFLKSLKKGLENLDEKYIIDICFSVKEAIVLIKKNDYSLIVTDIRMPNKTGIDLLIHLKDIGFRGGIKVMSAHKTEENMKKIKGMGILDVISKPFDLVWFQELIIDFFERELDSDVTFESIDLLSVLQVINIDKKSAVLQLDNEGEKGLIYFKDGEIINAEYQDFEGAEAVENIIELKSGNISVKKLKNKVKRVIDVPFTKFMLNILKKNDETKNGNGNFEEISPSEEVDIAYDNIAENQDIFDVEHVNDEEVPDSIILEEEGSEKKEFSSKSLNIDSNENNKEDEMSTMGDMLTILNNEVNGLKTASIFGKDGLPLAVENPAGLDIDAFSAKFAMVNALVSKICKGSIRRFTYRDPG